MPSIDVKKKIDLGVRVNLITNYLNTMHSDLLSHQYYSCIATMDKSTGFRQKKPTVLNPLLVECNSGDSRIYHYVVSKTLI